jgi:hypothetical protein
VEVVLYGRKDCHLCDEALALLKELQTHRSFDLHVRDVDGDPDLLARYDWRVPVITVDGREVAEGVIEPGALARHLTT